MNALKVVARKENVRRSSPREFVVKRLEQETVRVTLAGVMAARVELVNESLYKLAQDLYTQDADGVRANVDSITCRIRIAAPWGSVGWQYFGLRRWEARTLNKILRARQSAWVKGQRPPLYIYAPDSNTWHLNVHDYGSFDAAQWWLKRSAIQLKEWRGACHTPCRTP